MPGQPIPYLPNPIPLPAQLKWSLREGRTQLEHAKAALALIVLGNEYGLTEASVDFRSDLLIDYGLFEPMKEAILALNELARAAKCERRTELVPPMTWDRFTTQPTLHRLALAAHNKIRTLDQTLAVNWPRMSDRIRQEVQSRWAQSCQRRLKGLMPKKEANKQLPSGDDYPPVLPRVVAALFLAHVHALLVDATPQIQISVGPVLAFTRSPQLVDESDLAYVRRVHQDMMDWEDNQLTVGRLEPSAETIIKHGRWFFQERWAGQSIREIARAAGCVDRAVRKGIANFETALRTIRVISD